jgi:hypothetical protein
MTAEGPEADWYADPAGSGGERWWDGQAWTTRVRPSSQADAAQNRLASSWPANFGELPADWYPDPGGSGEERWWDGRAWATRMKPIHNANAKPGRPSTRLTASERIESISSDWYDDPDGSGGERFWDGTRWTARRRRKDKHSADASSVPPTTPTSRPERTPYAQIRPPAVHGTKSLSLGASSPASSPGDLPFWKRSDPVRLAVATIGVALIVVVGVVLLAQRFGHPGSWQTGYNAGSSDPASTQKIIYAGETPAGLCQNLLALARMSSDASSVDAADFMRGCRDGVEQALKVTVPPSPPQTVYIPMPAQPNPYPRGVVCDPLGRWDSECDLGKRCMLMPDGCQGPN